MSHRLWIIALAAAACRVSEQPAVAQSAVTAIDLTQVAVLTRKVEHPKLLHHLPPEPGGWSVTQTRNFCIRHRDSRTQAEQIARVAEQARAAAFLCWFAEARPSWEARCDIYLYPSGTAFYRATGVPKEVPAVSTTRCEAGRVLSRRIDLRGDSAHLLKAILPHEVMHIVMADHFGGGLPVWANEGMAVQAESRDRFRIHLDVLPYYRQQGQLLSVRQLVQLEGYPTSRQMGPFYAQSVSLVAFLTREKGNQTFVQFLRDARRDGSVEALRRHYGCDFETLNQRWLRYAFAAN